MDMVGHEMKTTVGLCNLKPCHSIKAQATCHATIKIPQAHRGEILIAGPTCLVNEAEAVPAPEKEVEMLSACRNIGNPFHTCSQFCYEHAEAVNSCVIPIVEVPVAISNSDRRRIAAEKKALFLLQHPLPQPGIIVEVDQLPILCTTSIGSSITTSHGCYSSITRYSPPPPHLSPTGMHPNQP